MKTLVDACIWSLAFRRTPETLNPQERGYVDPWKELVLNGDAVLIGPIRQEVLSGIRLEADFEGLREVLLAFEEIPIRADDYDTGARFFNRCRSKGLAGTHVDMLICAVAYRANLPILTADSDFSRYAEHLPIRLVR